MESSDEKLLNELAKTAKISHKKYTVDFKIKVLKLIHLNYTLHYLSNKLNIDRKTLREWMDQESSLLLVKNKDIKYRCNKTKGFIKVFTDEEEDQIYNWIITKRKNKLPISTKSLCCYAGTLKKEFADKMINTQLQWAYRFLHRYGFSIRRISHTGQALPDLKEKIKQNFVEQIIKKRKELNILDDEDFRIINMDETPCYLSMGFDTTIDFKGNTNIEIVTTGKENYRITTILAVAGDGTKLPPLIILKGESGKSIETKYRKLDFVQNGDVLIYCQKNGWCTNEIFEEWLKKIFFKYQNNVMD